MSKKVIDKNLIKKIEKLSFLNISEEESEYFVNQFNETLSIIEIFDKLNTKNITPTNQVTGLFNVFREDKIDKKRILTQAEALSNTKSSLNGYFMVKAIFNET